MDTWIHMVDPGSILWLDLWFFGTYFCGCWDLWALIFSHQVENCPLTPLINQSISVPLIWKAIFIIIKFPFVLLEPLFLSLIYIFSCINTIEINDFTTGKYSFSTTQETTLHMDITKWSIPKSNWLHFCSQRWKRCIQSAKTRPGANCVSDPQLLIARFRLKLKKTRKNTRPARHDLNLVWIPSRRDEWAHGTSWLTARLKNYGQRFAAHEVASKSTQRKGTREAKRSSKEASRTVEECRAAKERGKESKGEREQHIQLNAELQS